MAAFFVRWLFVLVAISLITSCGVRGPLRHPGEPKKHSKHLKEKAAHQEGQEQEQQPAPEAQPETQTTPPSQTRIPDSLQLPQPADSFQ